MMKPTFRKEGSDKETRDKAETTRIPVSSNHGIITRRKPTDKGEINGSKANKIRTGVAHRNTPSEESRRAGTRR